MIIEQLKERENFTSVEEALADWLLENGNRIRNITISDLADAVYTSPSTITRFCRKLGTDGYKDFCIRFIQEWESGRLEETIDLNLPFQRSDSFETIVRKMKGLNRNTIDMVCSQLDFDQLKRITYRMEKAKVINVFGIGISAIVAQDFETKIIRFGKQINANTNSVLLQGYANSSGSDDFNLMISQSGMSPGILQCAYILRERNCHVVSITFNADSPLAALSDEVISLKIPEEDSFTRKMESFAAFDAIHFVLDCLYCFLFRLNYDRNEAENREKAKLSHESEQRYFLSGKLPESSEVTEKG